MSYHLLRAFIAGSSFPVIVWPFMYLGYSWTLNPILDFSMGLVPIFLPILLGIANITFVTFESKIPLKSRNSRLLFAGGMYGLFLALYGNFVSQIPTQLFLITGPWQYITLIIAPVLYALIWRYIVKHLNVILKVYK